MKCKKTKKIEKKTATEQYKQQYEFSIKFIKIKSIWLAAVLHNDPDHHHHHRHLDLDDH